MNPTVFEFIATEHFHHFLYPSFAQYLDKFFRHYAFSKHKLESFYMLQFVIDRFYVNIHQSSFYYHYFGLLYDTITSTRNPFLPPILSRTQRYYSLVTSVLLPYLSIRLKNFYIEKTVEYTADGFQNVDRFDPSVKPTLVKFDVCVKFIAHAVTCPDGVSNNNNNHNNEILTESQTKQPTTHPISSLFSPNTLHVTTSSPAPTKHAQNTKIHQFQCSCHTPEQHSLLKLYPFCIPSTPKEYLSYIINLAKQNMIQLVESCGSLTNTMTTSKSPIFPHTSNVSPFWRAQLLKLHITIFLQSLALHTHANKSAIHHTLINTILQCYPTIITSLELLDILFKLSFLLQYHTDHWSIPLWLGGLKVRRNLYSMLDAENKATVDTFVRNDAVKEHLSKFAPYRVISEDLLSTFHEGAKSSATLISTFFRKFSQLFFRNAKCIINGAGRVLDTASDYLRFVLVGLLLFDHFSSILDRQQMIQQQYLLSQSTNMTENDPNTLTTGQRARTMRYGALDEQQYDSLIDHNKRDILSLLFSSTPHAVDTLSSSTFDVYGVRCTPPVEEMKRGVLLNAPPTDNGNTVRNHVGNDISHAQASTQNQISHKQNSTHPRTLAHLPNLMMSFDTRECSICHTPLKMLGATPAGYCSCYKCLTKYVEIYQRCPFSSIPITLDDIRSIWITK